MDHNDTPKIGGLSAPPNSKTPGAEVIPATSSQNAFHTGNPGLSTYKNARRVHRLGTHIHRIAGAFDPTGTLGDIDGFSDSDISISDTEVGHGDGDHDTDDYDDDDDDDVHSEHSDDESIHSNEDPQNDDSNNSQRQDGSTPATSSMGKQSKTLPSTRPTKALELPKPSVVNPITVSPTATTSTPLTRGVSPQAASAPVQSSSNSLTPKNTSPGIPSTSTPNSADVARTSISNKNFESKPVFQIVKVRKPDGTIVKVRRPIKATMGTSDRMQEKAESSHASNLESKAEIQTQTKEMKADITIIETEKYDDGSQQQPLKPPETKAEILQRRTSKVTQIVIWSIMIAFPLFFMILAIITAAMDKRPANNITGEIILRADKIAVSLWPIAYAAVIAQALRMYASYKVETGIRMIDLEQLISSHSVASAVKQPFILQRINWTSIMLLSLWSLSPLASQAILRMSHKSPSGKHFTSNLQYLDTNMQSMVFMNDHIEQDRITVDALLSHTIMSPIVAQEDYTDAWSNVKIPTMEHFTNQSKYENPYDYPLYNYSSLLGIPASVVPDGNESKFESISYTDDGYNTNKSTPLSGTLFTHKTSEFVLDSRYLTFDCPQMTEQSYGWIDEKILALSNSSLENNSTNFGMSSSKTMIMGMLPPESGHPGQPGQLMFASIRPGSVNVSGTVNGNVSVNIDRSSTKYGYTLCTWDFKYVRSSIYCDDTVCYVYGMHQQESIPETITIDSETYGHFIRNFTQSGEAFTIGTESAIQYYIDDPSSFGVGDKSKTPDLFNVDTFDMSMRLSTLLNTYWLASLMPSAITRPENGSTSNPPSTIGVNITYTRTDLVFTTRWGWLVTILCSSFLLLLGGIVGAICDSRTVGPDIFGFASSLAHRNKYMRVATGDSTMGGPQRARLLGDVTVMLQDVKPDQEVGRIALGTIENGGTKLQHGRLYK